MPSKWYSVNVLVLCVLVMHHPMGSKEKVQHDFGITVHLSCLFPLGLGMMMDVSIVMAAPWFSPKPVTRHHIYDVQETSQSTSLETSQKHH